jgi:signal transduction histidine kinase
MEQMHGEIGFSTEKDKGSTFWISLPILKEENAS